MKVVSVRYLLRRTLGPYQHEELECSYEPSLEEDESAQALMEAAKKVCVENSTEYLAKTVNKNKEV